MLNDLIGAGIVSPQNRPISGAKLESEKNLNSSEKETIHPPVAAVANLKFIKTTLRMSFHLEKFKINLDLLILRSSDHPLAFFVREVFRLTGAVKHKSFNNVYQLCLLYLLKVPWDEK